VTADSARVARAVILNVGISVVTFAAGLWAYDRYVRIPQTPRFGVVDVADVYRIKTSQLVDDMLKAGETREARDAVKSRADAFGNDVERLMASLAADCGCVVLARPAVVAGGSVPDFTDALKSKLGL